MEFLRSAAIFFGLAIGGLLVLDEVESRIGSGMLIAVACGGYLLYQHGKKAGRREPGRGLPPEPE